MKARVMWYYRNNVTVALVTLFCQISSILGGNDPECTVSQYLRARQWKLFGRATVRKWIQEERYLSSI
jgi:hypothetical protein